MSRLDLHQFLEKIDWVQINNGRETNSFRLDPDKIAVGFSPSKKDSDVIDLVNIRLGKGLCEKLGWHPKDRINVFHHPDDVLSFMLIKSQTDRGYILAKENNVNHCRIAFKWKRDFILKSRKISNVEFLIHSSGYLVFRVDN